MLLLKILTLVTLVLIFLQDMRGRSVYWFLFPILGIALILIRLQRQWFTEIWASSLINIVFLVAVLCLLTAYLSIKFKKIVDLTNHFLGLGDILFFLAVSCYLSVYNFIFFFIFSLVETCLIWLLYVKISQKKDKYIPLAGFLSIIFAVLLASDWYYGIIDISSDQWLVNLIHK